MVSICNISEVIFRVIQAMIWSALATIVCQATLDTQVSGTLLYHFMTNNVLHLNNTKAKEDAEAIPGAMIFSRCIWAAIVFGFLTAVIIIFFDVAKLIKEEQVEKYRKRDSQNLSHLNRTVSRGGSVNVTVDPDDRYFQSMESHMDHQYDTS